MITKKMTLSKIIQKYPQTAEVFLRHGFHCFGCHFASEETLEQAAQTHGMATDDLEKLLTELNTVAK